MLETFELAGAVTLLLWGIRMVQTGCSRLLGNRLERILRRATRKRPMAFGAGTLSALTLQSSTAVVLMVAGFTSTGMMTLYAALGTVLGAEIGASIAALILNLNIRALAPVFMAIGYVLFAASSHRTHKHAGRVLIGIGFILLALTLLGSVTSGLQDSPLFSIVIGTVAQDNALAFVFMALVTWLMHSTLAAVLILVQFVQDGTIDLSLALVLLLGANLGGAMPALIAGWSMRGSGRSVVLSNLLFRALIVMLGLIVLFTPGSPVMSWLPESGQSVVWFHFTLNLFGGSLLLLCLPLIEPPVAQWANRADHKRFSISEHGHRAIYLAAGDQDNPRRALANARNEALHIADVVYKMLNYTLEAFKDEAVVEQINRLDDDIDSLHREALLYIVSIDDHDDKDRREELRVQGNNIIDFMTNLEHIGDIIESSLMHLATSKKRLNITFTDEQANTVSQLHEELVDAFRLSQAVFTSASQDMAKELLSTKRQYRSKILRIRRLHIESLTGGISENMASTQLFMDVLRDLQRVSSHLTAVAYQVIKHQHNVGAGSAQLAT